MRIADIVIGERHRKDMGDLEAFAQSIAEIGLLHPVVVRSDGTLIAGARRIYACRLLGWHDIPVTVVDLEEVVRGEFAENAIRKDFTPSEAVAIGRALEPMERDAARERQAAGWGDHSGCENLAQPDRGKTLDRVASAVGMSRPTYTKAQAVVEAAEQEPEMFGVFAEQMDRTGKVSPAYKALKRRKKEQAKTELPPDLPSVTDRYTIIHGDMATAELPSDVDIIITDPPYPREFLPVYETLARVGAQALKPGGSMLVMVGQSYLPEVLAMMTPHMTYHWTLSYLTPGGQSAQLWQRKVNTFWKPVLWFTNGEYQGDWVGDVCRSNTNDNDKRYHDWGQSESGMADLIDRFTYPGQTILDPFCGGGTTGVVAVRMGRLFVGVDSDSVAIDTTKRRLMEIVAQ